MMSVLSAGYLLVSSIMLLRLMVGLTLSARLLSKAAPVYLNSARDNSIRISQAVAAPVTVGNVILLPPDVVDWAPCYAPSRHSARMCPRRTKRLRTTGAFTVQPSTVLVQPRVMAVAPPVGFTCRTCSDDYAMEVTGDRTGYAEVLLEMGRRSGPLLRGFGDGTGLHTPVSYRAHTFGRRRNLPG